jgi:RNAse (barnase) inhibitor barstar
MAVLKVDCRHITDWDSFHDVFARALGFPDFYGRNMSAWIDCMTYLDDPEDAMTTVHVQPGEILTIHLEHSATFRNDILEALVDCVEFVNFRRINHTSPEPAILALRFEA